MRRSFLAAVAVSALVQSARADVITDWNNILLDSIRVDKTNPPKASRAMAMVNVAMFQAVNGVYNEYRPYQQHLNAPFGVLPNVAAAAAAHKVMSNLYPARQSIFDTALAAAKAQAPRVLAQRSIDFGVRCGTFILDLRANDNSSLVVPYTEPPAPGVWEPTPPAFAGALLPNWPYVTPMCMASGSAYRVGAAPALDSGAYADALNEVKRLGSATSVDRTPDQTQIALFWADGAGTATPPGHWIVIAMDISAREHLNISQNARLLALLSMSVCDAAIACWDMKYEYNLWRPITAIRKADTDGNDDTIQDPAWTPLIATPPFPSYTSGHSTFSGASSQALARLLDTDDISFTTSSDGLPGVTRSFTSLSSAAEEAGMSRIYGGIHYSFDNTTALAMGRDLANDVVEGFLRYRGDCDHDLHVTTEDLQYVLANLGTSDPDADTNDDGYVNALDIVRVILQLGK